jgi:hypothetical protein
MSSKNTQTLTIAEAIEQGYTYFNEEGETWLGQLSDYAGPDKDTLLADLNPKSTYWILAKESTCFQLNDTDIPEAICDLVENQEDFYDEDLELVGYVSDVLKEKPELFAQLKDALNEKFVNMKFHPPTQIQLIIPK